MFAIEFGYRVQLERLADLQREAEHARLVQRVRKQSQQNPDSAKRRLLRFPLLFLGIGLGLARR